MSTLRSETAAGVSYLIRDGAADWPIVLLHGIGSNAQSFIPLMDALPSDRTVVAWNAPGYAGSTPLSQDWPRPDDYAAALERLLDALGLRRVALLGHSLGTLVAARFAAALPERVARLVLISPTLGYQAPHGGPMPANVSQRLKDLDAMGAEAFAEARAPNLLANPQGQPQLLAAVRGAMAAVGRPGYDHAVRMLAQGRLLDDLARVTSPTTVIVGLEDRTTPPATARQAFAALDPTGRHTYHEIPGAAHAVCQEQPHAVARLVTEALQKEAIVHA